MRFVLYVLARGTPPVDAFRTLCIDQAQWSSRCFSWTMYWSGALPQSMHFESYILIRGTVPVDVFRTLYIDWGLRLSRCVSYAMYWSEALSQSMPFVSYVLIRALSQSMRLLCYALIRGTVPVDAFRKLWNDQAHCPSWSVSYTMYWSGALSQSMRFVH